MIKVKRNKLTRRWRVLLIADNNETLSTSESLNSKEAAETNIAAQRKVMRTTNAEVVWE